MNHIEPQLNYNWLCDQLQWNSCHDDEHLKYEGQAKYEENRTVPRYLLSNNICLGR